MQNTPDKQQIADWFRYLQNHICEALSQTDGKGKFVSDHWERPGGGGGDTRIMQNGQIIEKGGVNFSAVHGKLPEKLAEHMGIEGDFFATGVSIVLHPHNPHVPIIHMNVRYFEASNGKYWFGGGIDLTPHYVKPEDAKFFHQELKQVCDSHHPSYYPEFKTWADNYFYIPHREETRGIGGIFFDRLSNQEGFDKASRWAFVQSVGEAFAPIYTYFMKKYGTQPFGENEKTWQHLRRGRYVEFNLVYDQGTKFGLQTAGRIESILMSLPQQAAWHYNVKPQAGSPEAFTLSQLKKGIDWV